MKNPVISMQAVVFKDFDCASRPRHSPGDRTLQSRDMSRHVQEFNHLWGLRKIQNSDRGPLERIPWILSSLDDYSID